MDDRKFTPPTEFPAEYVDSNGDKAVILGRGPHKVFPFIGHNAAGYARYWTEKGTFSSLGINGFDLHDIPKRIDEREDWDALQEVTTELEQAEARIEELEAKLAEARAGWFQMVFHAIDLKKEVSITLAELKGQDDE